MTSTRIFWSVSCRAICHQGVVQSRARGVLVPQTETPPETRVPTRIPQSTGFLPTLSGVISGVSSLARVLRQPVEHMRTMLRAAAIFPVNAGTSARDLLNFARCVHV